MSPTNQPKGRTPFICTPGVPICLRFKVGMGHSNLVSLDVSCIHEKGNLDAGNPEEQIPSQKTEKNRMESYTWMTGKHCLAEWWLVAAGVYLNQVQAQLLAADDPFTTQPTTILYMTNKEYQRDREVRSSLFLTFQERGSSFMFRALC